MHQTNNPIGAKSFVSKDSRQALLGHSSAIFWFTGFSGSGKSTLAYALEAELVNKGIAAVVLDGDRLRSNLNADLDFSLAGRAENIRRVAEVAKLMAEAGLVVICSFISPTTENRALAAQICSSLAFYEIFINCPLAVCRDRDVKGLYAKADRGEITEFTGVSSPFEVPENPDLVIKTAENPVQDCIAKLNNFVKEKLTSVK